MPSILLTNDDGVHADGIAALRLAVPEGWEIITVAPDAAVSQCGHRVTTDAPLRVDQTDSNTYVVSGTPADCVRIGLTSLPGVRPVWVFSGINHGGNMGADIYISGTVAAVREAAFLGVPAIGFSQYKKREWPFRWETASLWVRSVINELFAEFLLPGEYWNVNLPHLDPTHQSLPERIHCVPSRKALPVEYLVETGTEGTSHYQYTGVYADREREDDSDVNHCFNGHITISRLSL